MKFRKKPVVIEAIQWTGDNNGAVMDFMGQSWLNTNPDILTIPTLQGTIAARKGDWIIKGVKGEFYPCKPDIFEQTYEPDNTCCVGAKSPVPPRQSDPLLSV